MIDLQIYFNGLFIDPKIIYPRMVNFAQHNAIAMTDNNPGNIYDDAIIATKAAYMNLDALIAGKSGDKGSRKGGTASKNQARIDAEVYIGNNIGYVRSKFGGKNDPRFIATFPQLMNAFYNVSDTIFEENLTALIKKVHYYVAVLGADLETNLTTLKNAFVTSLVAHQNDNITVASDIVTVQMAADVLSDQLTDNVLLIARNNRRSQTAATMYFNTALLYPVKQKEYYNRTVLAGHEDEICSIIYDPTKTIIIINKGAVKLIFGMKLAGDKVGQTVVLMPGESSSQAFNHYFSNGDSLYVKNEETLKGMFRLEIK